MIKEFKTFILRGNVVDLAVGIVIGAAFKSVVDSFVANIITPVVGIFGKQDFSSLTIHVNDVQIRYGQFITDLLSFVIIAAAVFFVVVKPLNALNARRARGAVPEDETPAPSDEALILGEIRDLLRNGQANAGTTAPGS